MSETPKIELLASDTQTTLMIVRPGDVLFVMPGGDDMWPDKFMDHVGAIIRERLPDVRVVVLPRGAAFTTMAVEERE